MKEKLKDLCISFCIAFATFYIIYIIRGSILYSDLYNQGLDFLQYFKDHLNILSRDWLYNWNIGLGDNNFALVIYYLMSPFNIILLFMKKIDMIKILPLFITIKMTFMIFFASLYFEKIVTRKYRWIGALIYISTYNIMVYGNYQIMWLDTYVFLPLVLLGIEEIINDRGKYFYIISLFVFIVTDYYLAALLIVHIAIYGIIRYMFVNGKEGELKFIIKMILNSLISFLMAAFVLIPAFDITLSSAKKINIIPKFGTSFQRVIVFFTHNFIGGISDASNTYITLLGMIVVIPFLLLASNKKYRLYLIHIAIIFIAIFSDRINYILNFNYIPVGGPYRYNLFLNIYIAIYVCKFIDDLVNNKSKKVYLFTLISSIVYIVILFNMHGESKTNQFAINIAFIIAYTVGLFLVKQMTDILIGVFSVMLIIEVGLNYFYIYKNINLPPLNYRNSYSEVLQYIEDKYGRSDRIELRENYLYNIYISQDISGVSAYHSLMNSGYKDIGNVFGNTNDSDVRNQFKGRNIIAQLIGTKYYVSEYDYCPYIKSTLIDKSGDFYIYKLDNNYLKFFDEDSNISGVLMRSQIEKDALLYSKIYLDSNKSTNKENETTSLDSILNEYDITNNVISIQKDGDYYTRIYKKDNNTSSSISYQVNDKKAYVSENTSPISINNKQYYEVYIGYLKKGDKLRLNNSLPEGSKLILIDGEYVKNSINSINSIDIKSIYRTNHSFTSEFVLNKRGYVFIPIVYDKNWRIYCNGKNIKPLIVDGGFMAIKLDHGSYKLNMSYVPVSFYIGITCSAITFLVLISIKIYRIGVKLNDNVNRI